MTDEINQKLGRRNKKWRGSEIRQQIKNTLILKLISDAFPFLCNIQILLPKLLSITLHLKMKSFKKG
jgi:hypothetical protein